jgi:hypothetical protein
LQLEVAIVALENAVRDEKEISKKVESKARSRGFIPRSRGKKPLLSGNK